MQKTGMSTLQAKRRIQSIDALRALVLFGIILVHMNGGFGIKLQDSIQSGFDSFLHWGINFFLLKRCAILFQILFGVSFYIILKKPSYPSGKFVWRCFLLFLIGLLNKYYYQSDILYWYGLSGMVLVLFRNLNPRQILIAIVFVSCAAMSISLLKLGNLLHPILADAPSYSDVTPETRFSYWPYAILKHTRTVLNAGAFWQLANFLFGFWLGKIGFIEKMDKTINIKHVLSLACIYLFVLVPDYFSSSDSLSFMLGYVIKLLGCFFYGTTIIYLYNNVNVINKVLVLFEPYGKLGLTNYTFQGIIAIIFLSDFGGAKMGLPLSSLLGLAIAFYIFQAFFSTIWLRYFKNGPMEYLWRCATEKQWLPIKK